MRARCFQLIGFVLMGLGLNGPSAALAANRAGPDLQALRDQVINLRLEVLEKQAEIEALKEEEKLLDQGPGPIAAPPPPGGSDKPWSIIQAVLKESQGKRRDELTKYVIELEAAHRDAVQKWRAANQEALSFVDQVADAEARLGPFWDESSPGVLGARGRGELFLTLGALVVLAGWLFTVHEARAMIRWRARAWGSTPTLIALALLPSFLGCSGQEVRSLLDARSVRFEKDAQKLQAELTALSSRAATLTQEVEAARKRVEAKRNSALQHRTLTFLPAAKQKEKIEADLRDAEGEAQAKLGQLLVEAQAATRIAEDGLKVLDSLAESRARLAHEVLQGNSRFQRRGVLFAGLCLGFLTLAVFPLLLVRRRNRKQRAQEAATCPRCLESGNLEIVTSDVKDPRYPEPQHVECPNQTCRYKFRESYLRVSRQCFPVVGVRGSGKTHWLVTGYDQIKNGNVPARATLQKAPSLADQEFDNYVKEVLENHRSTSPTLAKLPYPLMFSVRDRDRLGKTAAMLNVFDFAGALVDQDIFTSTMRRRALLMDGFILFLDPTQVRGQGSELSIEDQIQALIRFYEEMRDLRGLKAGEVVEVPVAVCVSKMDLLMTRNPLGTRAKPWLEELRATMADKATLDIIQTRSRLLAQELPVIFPGWNLERTLRDNFGGRFMFFPLTPVGLEEGELGVENLMKRTFAPFGVLEPILWLLHMKGFCIF